MLEWLREIGLKYKAGSLKGGKTSSNKEIPEQLFELDPEDIAFFLACYWDCDGGITKWGWYAKTISRELAEGLQGLLDRLGFQAYISSAGKYTSVRGEREAWLIYVWDPKRMQEIIGKYCLVKKWENFPVRARSSETIDRSLFIKEVKEYLASIGRPLKLGCLEVGLDPQHCLPKKLQKSPRISLSIAQNIADKIGLKKTQIICNSRWRKVVKIVPDKIENVADLSIRDHHNFVANGIIIHNTYQEQLMKAIVVCCGYSDEQSDVIRELVGKKKPEDMVKLLPGIREELEKRGWTKEKSESFVSTFKAASGYAFNKSHSLAYSVIGYACMWLKTRYPLEWWNSVLSNSNNEDLKKAAQHCRDIVVPPNINKSEVDFYIIDDGLGKLVFPLGMVFGVKKAGAAIISKKPFISFEDFFTRVEKKHVNLRVVSSLIWAGAFDEICGVESVVDRNRVYRQYLELRKDKKRLEEFKDLAEEEVMMKQLDMLAIGSADFVELIKRKTGLNVKNPGDVALFKVDALVRIAGMVQRAVHTVSKKKKEPMGFLDMINESSMCSVTIFPDQYPDMRQYMVENKILVIEGKVNIYQGKIGLVANRIIPFNQEEEPEEEENNNDTQTQ